jgi:hypothetical protein
VERDLETLAAAEAPAVSRELRRIAKRGGTEADFRREAARVFEETASAVGLTIAPRDEYHVARGKVDSLYNRLVLEYKKPGLLRPTNGMSPNRKAIEQVKDYIIDVGVRERREAPTAGRGYHGWVPPDLRSPCGRGMVSGRGRFSEPGFDGVAAPLVLPSTGAALIPENLVEDFGPRQWRPTAIGPAA